MNVKNDNQSESTLL